MKILASGNIVHYQSYLPKGGRLGMKSSLLGLFILVSWSLPSLASSCLGTHAELEQEFEILQPLIDYTQESLIELALEKDSFAKLVLNSVEFSDSSVEGNVIVIDGQAFRIDLTIADLQDQVNVLIAKKFPEYKAELNSVQEDFLTWIKKIKELSSLDKKLLRVLNNNLIFQLYDAKGVALPHMIGLTTKNRALKIARNKDIKKFNKVANDPEARLLVPGMSLTIPSVYQNTKFTVAKIKDLSANEIRKARTDYYEKYCDKLYWQEEESINPIQFECSPTKRYPITLARKSISLKQDKNDTVTLFNAIHAHPEKYLITTLLQQELELDGEVTPNFVKNNQTKIEEILKEYTYQSLLSQEDDETVLKLRSWISQKHEEIMAKLQIYNEQNLNDQLDFKIKHPKFRVRRAEALDQYESLLKLFPDAPWIEGQAFTLVDANGKTIITGKNRLQKLAWRMGNTIKKVLSPENLVAYGVGGALLMTTGNYMLASVSKQVIRDSIHGYRYDKSLRETFEQTPFDIAFSLTSVSGFSAGKIPYMMFVGSVHGGVRSAVTGQNVKTGMIVGAASEVLRSTLPREISHPTIALSPNQVIDGAYAAKSILLEAGFNSAYHGFQGATVAAIEGDRIGIGAAKGAIYGVGETALMVSLFGIQYDMHGLIGEDILKEDFALEANYINEVRTYGIDLSRHDDLAADMVEASEIIDFRLAYGSTGQWVQKVLGNEASFSAPGFVTSPTGHLGSISTMSHEVAHQLQYWDMGGANFLITYGKISSKHGTHGSHENGFDVMVANPDRDVNVMEQYRDHD